MAENGGRPSIYTSELASTICARIADGQSVREICRDDAMPGMTTVFRWLAENEGFRQQYARAKDAMAEYLAEDILDIADDGTNDWMERRDDNGGSVWVANGEHLQRSKLRVDARKWLLSKMLPKKYGDRTVHAGDPEQPLIPAATDERELAKAIVAALAGAAVKPEVGDPD